jgi:hypothetical protein
MDTALFIGAVLLALLLVWQDRVHALRIAAGLLLAFVLPGIGAAAALFPNPRLPRIERIVVSAGMSLALLVVGGILVEVGGASLRPLTWSILTGGAAIVFILVRHVRWRRAFHAARLDDGEHELDDPVTPGSNMRPPSLSRTVRRLAPLVLVAALLGGASWIGWHSATAQGQDSFTALSMIPDDDPNTTDQVRPLTIAVDCRELATTSYVLRVSGITTAATRFRFQLTPGEVWKQSLQVPAHNQITADLYRAGDTKPYRTVFVSGQVEQ